MSILRDLGTRVGNKLKAITDLLNSEVQNRQTDSNNRYTKTESDSLFLGISDQAVDSAKLNGLSASNYIRYFEQVNAPTNVPSGSIWKDTDDGVLYLAFTENEDTSWFEI